MSTTINTLFNSIGNDTFQAKLTEYKSQKYEGRFWHAIDTLFNDGGVSCSSALLSLARSVTVAAKDVFSMPAKALKALNFSKIMALPSFFFTTRDIAADVKSLALEKEASLVDKSLSLITKTASLCENSGMVLESMQVLSSEWALFTPAINVLGIASAILGCFGFAIEVKGIIDSENTGKKLPSIPEKAHFEEKIRFKKIGHALGILSLAVSTVAVAILILNPVTVIIPFTLLSIGAVIGIARMILDSYSDHKFAKAICA